MRGTVLSLLFLMAFLERVVFDLGPNVELVTATMLLAGLYFGRRESVWLVMAVMVGSDLVLGNTRILLFTWSGFLIPAWIIPSLINKIKRVNKVLLATGTGLTANLFFWVWTNFGVWLFDGWGMYSNDLSGLVRSYINALPFLKLQMLSTLLFVPFVFGLVEFVLWSRSFALPRFGFLGYTEFSEKK